MIDHTFNDGPFDGLVISAPVFIQAAVLCLPEEPVNGEICVRYEHGGPAGDVDVWATQPGQVAVVRLYHIP